MFEQDRRSTCSMQRLGDGYGQMSKAYRARRMLWKMRKDELELLREAAIIYALYVTRIQNFLMRRRTKMPDGTKSSTSGCTAAQTFHHPPQPIRIQPMRPPTIDTYTSDSYHPVPSLQIPSDQYPCYSSLLCDSATNTPHHTHNTPRHSNR